ncbi:uncharacterized protein LOC135160243 [Diachasmimorpha longicaudata]|uniref:uncharacterized protein LOC135160243 n=1 Tax=Diachasmimorpha longicaudata TaxID=58733 RepID=UPI0030B8C57A
MFSTKKRLIERTGYNDVGRFEYLKLLTIEFKTTASAEAKRQVLGNLANFAYDPVNYHYIRRLNIIDLFLYVLSESDTILVRFAIGGLCNLCSDPVNREFILRNRGVSLVLSLLRSPDEETVLSAITTLMFLVTDTSRSDIITPQFIQQLGIFKNSTNRRIQNLASIFLKDYCNAGGSEQKMFQRIKFPEQLFNSWVKMRSINYGALPNLIVGSKVSVTRQVTKNDIITFCQLTNDYNPIHTSEKPIVHGALLNGFLSGVLGTKLPGPGTIVLEQQLRYKNPCYAGDKVEIIVEVLEVRKIIKCGYKLVANAERIVLEGEGKFILTRVGAGGPEARM